MITLETVLAQVKHEVAIGDKISYRGTWGKDAPVLVTVLEMELTERAREKYGTPITFASRQAILDNRVIFTLDNGRWCYSEQVEICPAECIGKPVRLQGVDLRLKADHDQRVMT